MQACRFPHGCGTGECGSCKCKLLSGQVAMDAYSPGALSDAEREQGLILACRSRVVSDVKISWLSSAAIQQPMVKFNAKVFRVAPVAHDVFVVTLATPPGQGFQFHPGQFAKLRFGKLPARKYSMASQPGQDLLEFHIRIVPDGMVSQYVASQLREGETVEVRGPFGDAYWEGLEEAHTGPLVLLAGGTGLAPILSVLDAALKDGVAPEQVHLYHGVRAERDLYAESRLTCARLRNTASASRRCIRKPRANRPARALCTRPWNRTSTTWPTRASTWPAHRPWWTPSRPSPPSAAPTPPASGPTRSTRPNPKRRASGPASPAGAICKQQTDARQQKAAVQTAAFFFRHSPGTGAKCLIQRSRRNRLCRAARDAPLRG